MPFARFLLQKINAIIHPYKHTIGSPHNLLTAPGTRNIRDSMYTCTFNLKNSTIMKTKQIITNFTQVPHLTTGLRNGMNIR